MKVKTSSIEDLDRERELAKAYWRTPGTHPPEHVLPPHHIEALLRIVVSLGAKRILEFGSGSGRNLDYIRSRQADRLILELCGIDINQASIADGRKRFDLDLRHGDEALLGDIADGSFDLVFTVSVLDHIPDPSSTIAEMLRITRRYGVFVEPYLEKLDGIVARVDAIHTEWHTLPSNAATTATYLHDYPRLFDDPGCRIVFDAPMPTHLNKLGPFYRFYLVEKQQPEIQAGEPSEMDDPGLRAGLRDEVVRFSQLCLLSNIHRMQMIEAVARKFAKARPGSTGNE